MVIDMETPNTTEVETPVVTEEVDGGSLPSYQDEVSTSLEKFSLDDEFVSKNFKNGKLYGRFDSLQAVLDTLKKVEDSHSNVMRDIKGGKYQEVDQNQVQQQKVQETVMSLIPEYMENGMQLTPELEAKLTESGVDIRDVKLGAIEFKEALTKSYEVVGGKEVYDNMIEWAKDNLSEQEIADFNLGVKNINSSKYAIKGLFAEYQQATANGEPPRRVYGDDVGNSTVARPYATLDEVLRDRAYISGKGRMDSKAIELHNKRMAMTPDSVFNGR